MMRSVCSPLAVSRITDIALALAQPAHHLEPVHAGQHQVEHHEVGALLAGDAQRVRAVAATRVA